MEQKIWKKNSSRTVHGSVLDDARQTPPPSPPSGKFLPICFPQNRFSRLSNDFDFFEPKSFFTAKTASQCLNSNNWKYRYRWYLLWPIPIPDTFSIGRYRYRYPISNFDRYRYWYLQRFFFSADTDTDTMKKHRYYRYRYRYYRRISNLDISFKIRFWL